MSTENKQTKEEEYFYDIYVCYQSKESIEETNEKIRQDLTNEKSVVLIKALSDGSYVQLAKSIDFQKAQGIKKRFNNIGLYVKMEVSLTLQELDSKGEDESEKVTIKQCPICNVPWGESVPEICPSCKFSPRMASEESILRHKIAWEERSILEAERKRLADKAKEEKKEKDEANLREKIRKELEKEMYANIGRQSIFKLRGGGGAAALLTLALLAVGFGGGFLIGSGSSKTHIAPSNSSNKDFKQSKLMDLMESGNLPASEGNEDSLMFLIENGGNQQTQAMQKMLLLTQESEPAEQTSSSESQQNQVQTNQNQVQTNNMPPFLASLLPQDGTTPSLKSQNIHLFKDYIALLLQINETARAKEVLDLISKNKDKYQFTQSDLTQLDIRILAKKMADTKKAEKAAAYEAEIEKNIATLSQQEQQATAWLMAAGMMQEHENWAKNMLSKAEKIIKEQSDTEIQGRLSEQLHIKQLELKWQKVLQAAKNGLWGEVSLSAKEISANHSDNEPAMVSFASGLLSYRAAMLTGNYPALKELEGQIVQSISGLNYTRREQALSLWREHALFLPKTGNELISQAFQAALESYPPTDEQNLQLLRLCIKADIQTCSQHNETRLSTAQDVSIDAAKTFAAQLHFYSILDAAKLAYKDQQYATTEVWVRMAFGQLFIQS